MKINKTIPKDKSSYVYYADKGRDLIATKPLLIIYKLTKDEVSFRRGQYVHSQKEWLDWESFQITDDEFIGWVDISNELEKKLTCDVCYTETINKKDEYDNIYCDDCKEL